MRPGPALAGLAVLFAVAAVAASAEATVVLPMSLADLVARSDLVARVRVGQVRLEPTDEAPFRATSLELLEVFAGQAGPGERLELWQRGDGRVRVLGDPRLQPGDEGLVFLVRRGGRLYLTALAQSWWRLEGAPQARRALRDLSGLTFVAPRSPVATPPDDAPWDELRRLLRRACQEAGR